MQQKLHSETVSVYDPFTLRLFQRSRYSRYNIIRLKRRITARALSFDLKFKFEIVRPVWTRSDRIDPKTADVSSRGRHCWDWQSSFDRIRTAATIGHRSVGEVRLRAKSASKRAEIDRWIVDPNHWNWPDTDAECRTNRTVHRHDTCLNPKSVQKISALIKVLIKRKKNTQMNTWLLRPLKVIKVV